MWTVTLHHLAHPNADRNDLRSYRAITRRFREGGFARLMAAVMASRTRDRGTYLSHTVTQGRPSRRKEPSR